MTESTLSVSYYELIRAVGRFLGYGADPDDWDASQLSEIQDHVKTGLRRFYGSHQWSFLRPEHTLTAEQGVASYALPANFATIMGDITYEDGSLKRWGIRLIDATTMRRVRAFSREGKPEVAAVVPLVSDGETGQRKQITFYPTPDSEMIFTFNMQVLPDTVTPEAPYPLGGQLYAEAIREACLAAAESEMDDVEQVHAQRFLDEVTKAIGVDRTHRAIEHLGYNSDGVNDFAPQRRRSQVTFNGVPLSDL